MRKLLTKILSVIVAVTATLGLVMLPKTAVQANEISTFGAIAGASVRYGETLEETGLRFTIDVNKSWYTNKENNLEGATFGAIVTTAEYAKSLGENFVYDASDDKIADTTCVFDDEYSSDDYYRYYSTVTYKFTEEWINDLKGTFGNDVDVEQMKLKALATELVCRPYYIDANGEYNYAEVSNARSMVKVANSAVISKDPVPNKDYVAFQAKYISKLTESTSEIFIERETGAIYGMSNEDLAALNGADVITANAEYDGITFAIENGAVTDHANFFANYVDGNEYYLTAYTGYNVYRIKYVLATKFIENPEDFDMFNHDWAATGQISLFDGYYVLINDIDMANHVLKDHNYSTNNVFPGNGEQSAGLTGTFDGLGHVVSNVTAPSNGIFSTMCDGHIKNVAFTNVKLTGYYTGLFAHQFYWSKKSEDIKPRLTNVYVSVDEFEYSRGGGGVLTGNASDPRTIFTNVVVEYLGFDATEGSTEMNWLNSKYVFAGFTPYAYIPGNYQQYENSFLISKAPLSVQLYKNDDGSHKPIVYIPQNKATVNEDSSVTITDPFYKQVVEHYAGNDYNKNFIAKMNVYDDYYAMAQDAEANKEALESFSSKYWVVVNGVPTWKPLYESRVDVLVTDSQGNRVLGDVELKDNTTKLSINLADPSGYIYDTTITVPDGIELDSTTNTINLKDVPTSKGSYELTLSAIVEGQTIERVLTVVYTNEIYVTDKVLYSAYDKSLDLPSLNKALDNAGIESIKLEDIKGYYVGDSLDVVSDLELEVIIQGTPNYHTFKESRRVEDYYSVTILIGDKAYKLANVYAYTRLIDEIEDLAWFSTPYIAVGSYTGDERDKEYTSSATHVYAQYDGYYLMTKDLDGSNYNESGVDYLMPGLTGSGNSKGDGLRGVFDGNGHTISNIKVQSRGIFGFVTAGVVKNVAFKNITTSGYYSCVIAHAVSNKDITGDTVKDIGTLENIYIEGTNMSYENSNGHVGIIAQNNTYANIVNVVVKHTLNDQEKEAIEKGNRWGVYNNQYDSFNSSMCNNIYVIADAPLFTNPNETGGAYTRFSFADYMLTKTDETKATSATYTHTHTVDKVKGTHDCAYVKGSYVKYELKDEYKKAFTYLTELWNNETFMEGHWGGIIYTLCPNASGVKSNTIEYTQARIDPIPGVKHYANTSHMATDSANNTTGLGKLSSNYWTVVNGVPYWKTLYDETVKVVATDSEGNAVENIKLSDSSTEISLKLVDASGYVLPNATITAPVGVDVDNEKGTIKLAKTPIKDDSYNIEISAIINGIEVVKTINISAVGSVELVIDGDLLLQDVKEEITFNYTNKVTSEIYKTNITTLYTEELDIIDGNVVKLKNNPTSEGSYEVTVSATIDGQDVSDIIIIEYSIEEIQINDKVLYSGVDKALDLPSLNAAISKVGYAELTQSDIDSYYVDDIATNTLDLNVVISGKNENRTINKSTQQVIVMAYNKAFVLNNVYAYTKLIDEYEDLAYFGSGVETTGYYLLTKNLTGSYTLAEPVVPASTNFTGVFDGNGYYVDSLTVGSRGIFYNLKEAIVKNVAFTNIANTGYYSCLLGHVDNGNNRVENVYVEINSIVVRGGGLYQQTLATNSKYINVIVEYAIAQENVLTVLRTTSNKGNISTFAPHKQKLSTAGVFTDCYSISYAPIGCSQPQDRNATWSSFVMAENQVVLTPNAETGRTDVAGANDWATTVLGTVNFDKIVKKTTAELAIDVVYGIKAYNTIADMANDYVEVEGEKVYNNATSLATFSSAYWTVVNGVPTWKTLNA